MGWKELSKVLKLNEPPQKASCPICGAPSKNGTRAEHLVIHHWGKGSRTSAIREGRCRWICRGCNNYLGHKLPDIRTWDYTWEEQRDLLFKRARSNPSSFPYFDGEEKFWSIVIDPKDIMTKKPGKKGKNKLKEVIERAMKVAQRELPNDKLKVEVLSSLVDLLEKVGGKDGNKPTA